MHTLRHRLSRCSMLWLTGQHMLSVLCYAVLRTSGAGHTYSPYVEGPVSIVADVIAL